MGYAFPNSPAVGDVANGYIWNGAAWTGSPAPLAGEIEKYVQLDGLGSAEVTVPSWATGVEVFGTLFGGSAAAFGLLQISTDGSTFITSGYNAGGPYHDTNAASPYKTQGAVATAGFYLSYPRDNLNVPHNFKADVNLVTASTQIVTCRAHSIGYNTAGAPADGIRNQWILSYIQPPLTARVQKLRIVNGGAGNFQANSFAYFKWIGPQTANPTGAAIVTDAPADGREYVRVNGVWRLKSQLVDLSGASQAAPAIVSMPLWAKFFRLQGQVFVGAAASFVQMQVCTDGTNWVNGANDYSTGGMVHNCGSSGFANYPTSQTTAFLLTVGGDNLILAQSFDVLGEIEARTASGGILGGLQIMSHSLDSAAATLMRAFIARAYVNIAQPVGTRIQMLRFFPNTTTPWQAGSRMSVEWS
jgi:hypothetical protein